MESRYAAPSFFGAYKSAKGARSSGQPASINSENPRHLVPEVSFRAPASNLLLKAAVFPNLDGLSVLFQVPTFRPVAVRRL